MSVDTKIASKNERITDWVNLYLDDLMKYAKYKTSDSEVAENMVQDTYEAVIKSYDKFEGNSNPKTWIFGILKNKIKDHYKSKKVSDKQVSLDKYSDDSDTYDKYFDDTGHWKKESMPMQWSNSENNLLEDQEFMAELLNCLNRLPDKWRECVTMKFLDEYKGQDICDVLEIQKTNYWQMLHRAKLQLRDCLEINWFNI